MSQVRVSPSAESAPDAAAASLSVGGASVDVAVRLSRRAVRREFGHARRIESVSLIETPDGWQARVTAVWHRAPWTVDASLPAALALVEAGTRCTVRRQP